MVTENHLQEINTVDIDEIDDIEMIDKNDKKENPSSLPTSSSSIPVKTSTAKTQPSATTTKTAAVGTLFRNELQVRVGSEIKIDAPIENGGPQGGPIWRLRSVVRHEGISAKFGHYTTYVRGEFDPSSSSLYSSSSSSSSSSQPEKWYHHNDEFVTTITERDVMSEETQENAYILMYELVENDTVFLE